MFQWEKKKSFQKDNFLNLLFKFFTVAYIETN